MRQPLVEWGDLKAKIFQMLAVVSDETVGIELIKGPFERARRCMIQGSSSLLWV
jgi:hypothetical protein